jgi:hypothetical protein
MRKVLLASALMLSLMGCASGSLSLNPADLHLAVGIGGSLYSAGCAIDPSATSACSKANQKKATNVENAVNGVVSSLPTQPASN